MPPWLVVLDDPHWHIWYGQAIQLTAHQACRWVAPDQLTEYPFTPADLPFVRRLASGEIAVDGLIVGKGRG